ncbi:MAG: hypothetical protein AB9882_13445 [Ignavibacteriaceae bacterium]
MKKMLFVSAIFLFILFSGCTKENSVNPPSNNETGKVFLKFDKTNAPSNVVSVTATLTREGYSPVTGSLNIQSDTTAEILLSDLVVGTWQLKVDAMDSSSLIIYTGEASVNILAGVTTQVSLILHPTGQGKGNIYITVSWGSSSSGNWLDYMLNPILRKGNNSFDNFGVWAPKVLIEGSQYKMWYSNLTNSGVSCIGYAISNDGLNWTKPVMAPVLTRGSGNSWDSYSVSPGQVIKVGSTYRMYYTGYSSMNGNWDVGLATSEDGINWVKYNNPVLYAGNENQIIAGDIVVINSIYYLYYTVRNLPYYSISLATSTDGISWTKYAQNPILSVSQSWEGTGIYWPSVDYSNGKYYMVFQNVKDNLTAFGLAYSTDGKNWTKNSNNPFFTNNDTYNHWVDYICYPELEIINNEWRVYYSGVSPTSECFVAVTRKL